MGGTGDRAEPGGQDWTPEIEKIRRRLAAQAMGGPQKVARQRASGRLTVRERIDRFGVQDLIDPRDSRPLLCAWVRDAYRVLPGLTGRPPSAPAPSQLRLWPCALISMIM